MRNMLPDVIRLMSETVRKQHEARAPEPMPILSEAVKEYQTSMDTGIMLHIFSRDGLFVHTASPYFDARRMPKQSGVMFNVLPADGSYHRHNCFELTYVAEGAFTYVISGEPVTLHKGDFLLMNPQCVHFDRVNPIDTALVYVSYSVPSFTDFIERHNPENQAAQLLQTDGSAPIYALRYQAAAPDIADKSEMLLADMLWESQWADYRYEDVLNALSYRLLRHLSDSYTAIPLAYSGSVQQELLMAEIETYIQSHLATVTTVELQTVFHFGYDYFNRLMRKHRGITLKQYVQKRRLSEAKMLLMNTDLSVNNIMNRVGYQNSQYFYQLFEKEAGMTPTQFRKLFSERS